MKKYQVQLSAEERDELRRIVSSGRASARAIRRAQILLKSDEGWSDPRIAEAFGVVSATVHEVRRQYVEEGVAQTLARKPGYRPPRALDGTSEAHLIALTCSEPPAGHERWTLRLLASRLVELGYVSTVSHETVRQTLHKSVLKPWLAKEWCIPPQQDAAFVTQMEQVLDEYQQPSDPRFPLVCMDESSKQLTGEVRDPLPLQPGQVERQDCHYQRLGVGNLFIAFEPARGQRDVTVTDKRGKAEWAAYIKKIVDELYPQAEVITLVCDQLNTHALSSLYATFPAPEAHRLARKLRLVHTPKHGSWLNMAEIEFSALSRQCTDRRFDSWEHLEREVAAWTHARNAAATTVHWRFTTADARIKLASLYPTFGP